MEFETFTSIETGTLETGSIDTGSIPTLTGRVGYCAGCAAETVFDQPDCLDGHGDLCPEWICTDCGLAVDLPVGHYLQPVPAAHEPLTGRQIHAA